MSLCGSPLTHERFTRRHRGTYGPSGNARAGDLDFLGPSTPLAPNLKLCGDSCFPGIGVPSVAASGIIAAHCFVGLEDHREVLARMSRDGTLCVGRGWWDTASDDDGGGGGGGGDLDDGSRTPRRLPPMNSGGRISMLCDAATPGEYTTATVAAAAAQQQ